MFRGSIVALCAFSYSDKLVARAMRPKKRAQNKKHVQNSVLSVTTRVRVTVSTIVGEQVREEEQSVRVRASVSVEERRKETKRVRERQRGMETGRKKETKRQREKERKKEGENQKGRREKRNEERAEQKSR